MNGFFKYLDLKGGVLLDCLILDRLVLDAVTHLFTPLCTTASDNLESCIFVTNGVP